MNACIRFRNKNMHKRIATPRTAVSKSLLMSGPGADSMVNALEGANGMTDARSANTDRVRMNIKRCETARTRCGVDNSKPYLRM